MTDIQKSIVKTLVYFSIFKHPLRIDELHKFLLFKGCRLDEVKHEALKLKENGKIFEFDGFFQLEDKKEWVEARIKGERVASWFWKVAKFMAHVMKRFPFVRGIFVSGALAKWNISMKSDIDFFIITKRGRLWMARSLLIGFKKVFLLNKRKFFCLNYFISDDHLEIEDKNIFTAIEIATLKPIFNLGLYFEFMRANSWIRGFLPNYYVDGFPGSIVSERKSLFQSFSEKFFEGIFNRNGNSLDKFDLALMEKWKKIWKVRYPNLGDEERDLMFRCRPYSSKAHPNNFQNFVLTNYDLKVRSIFDKWDEK